jgi:hypothetical protein
VGSEPDVQSLVQVDGDQVGAGEVLGPAVEDVRAAPGAVDEDDRCRRGFDRSNLSVRVGTWE